MITHFILIMYPDYRGFDYCGIFRGNNNRDNRGIPVIICMLWIYWKQKIKSFMCLVWWKINFLLTSICNKRAQIPMCWATSQRKLLEIMRLSDYVHLSSHLLFQLLFSIMAFMYYSLKYEESSKKIRSEIFRRIRSR
jgi:hypothetical protein